MKRRPNIWLVSRRTNIRDYTYTARVCQYTGRLLGISAGCRRWRGWSDALRYYSPVEGFKGRWSPTYINESSVPILREAHRVEAFSLLRKLRWDVQQVQARIRRRRR